MDSLDPHENLLSPPAIEPNEREPSNSPVSTASIKSDLSYSEGNSQPSLANYKLSSSSRSLEIEEAQLAVQREKLKVLKEMADNLSAIHRGFLKAYKLKGSIITI